MDTLHHSYAVHLQKSCGCTIRRIPVDGHMDDPIAGCTSQIHMAGLSGCGERPVNFRAATVCRPSTRFLKRDNLQHSYAVHQQDSFCRWT